jgi:hypothetical protein
MLPSVHFYQKNNNYRFHSILITIRSRLNERLRISKVVVQM